jgi:hypothetical protein
MRASKHGQPSALLKAAGIAVLALALQVVLVPLFAAPAANIAPRDLPILVAGQPQATAGLTAALQGAEPGALKIIQRPDAAAADRALRIGRRTLPWSSRLPAFRCTQRRGPARRWLLSWSRQQRPWAVAVPCRWWRWCPVIRTTRAVVASRQAFFPWRSPG